MSLRLQLQLLLFLKKNNGRDQEETATDPIAVNGSKNSCDKKKLVSPYCKALGVHKQFVQPSCLEIFLFDVSCYLYSYCCHALYRSPLECSNISIRRDNSHFLSQNLSLSLDDWTRSDSLVLCRRFLIA